MLKDMVELPRSACRLEIITGVGGRRRWSDAERERILAEATASGAVVWVVARRHGLSLQHLFTWLRAARRAAASLPVALPLAFVPALVGDSGTDPARQHSAGGTDVVIGRGVVDEVGAHKEPLLSSTPRVGRRHSQQDASAFTGQNLVPVVVAAIGQGRDLLRADGLSSLTIHRNELGSVVALVDDVMGDDEMMLGIDGDLDVVADDAGAAPARRHGARVRVGQGDLPVVRDLHLRLHLAQEGHLSAQSGDLLADTLRPCLGNVVAFPIRSVERREVAGDAGIHLFQALGDVIT